MDQFTIDPAATKFDQIELDDAAKIARKAQRLRLPHLGEFLRDIAGRLSPAEEAYGRRYQREIIARRALEIASPLTGEPIMSSRSIAIRGRVYYYFADSIDYYIASTAISLGYPLAALYLPQMNSLLSWKNPRRFQLMPQLIASYIEQDRMRGSQSKEIIPVIIMGHQNFAHHMWNELSALERLLADTSVASPPEILLDREPLGALETIFPEVAAWKVTRVQNARRLCWSDPGKLYANLAGFRISTSLRSRIVRHANASASEKVKVLVQQIRGLAGPVFWLSVRTQVPTFANQREILIAIALQILNTYSRCTILFDGFSLPEDWRATDDDTRTSYEAAANAAKREIDAMIGELSKRRAPAASQVIANAGGLGVLDSIALAQLADVYFCHKGSIQHKIAWTANIPGIIHGPRRVLSGDPSEWHASRMDAAVRPVAIDATMVEDVSKAKQSDYRALDCDSLSEFVLGYFARCMSPTGH